MTDRVRLARGVWCPAPDVADPLVRLRALLAAAPDGAVVAGLTAARLHGFWLPAPHPDEPVELILRHRVAEQRGHAGCRRDEVRGRRRRVPDHEVALVNGFETTGVARTWVDLAEDLQVPELLAAGDSALRARATPDELAEAVDRARGRRGVTRARYVLPMLDSRSRSRPESHLRAALVTRGLPVPGVNVPVFSTLGEWLAEPDLSYDDARLAIEYNGAGHADINRMRRDITRTLDLDDRGDWQTVTFGPVQVFRRPDEAAATVARLRRNRLRDLAA